MSTDAKVAGAHGPAEAPGAPDRKDCEFRQALVAWGTFFILLVLLNGTIPFALGADLRAWTQSPIKSALFGFLFYGVLFLGVPLVLSKGWETVRQPAFLAPLCAAILGITLWRIFPLGVVIALVLVAYLHRRFDLAGLGIRSRGWKGDLLAIFVMGMLGFSVVLMQPVLRGLSFQAAIDATLGRLFLNPASSFENLFYFGFLTERLSYRAGKWATPLLVGMMYTAHEMSNPEYWYGGMNFVLIFVGVALWAAIYLWRRSTVAIWLGDGAYRFALNLF